MTEFTGFPTKSPLFKMAQESGFYNDEPPTNETVALRIIAGNDATVFSPAEQYISSVDRTKTGHGKLVDYANRPLGKLYDSYNDAVDRAQARGQSTLTEDNRKVAKAYNRYNKAMLMKEAAAETLVSEGWDGHYELAQEVSKQTMQHSRAGRWAMAAAGAVLFAGSAYGVVTAPESETNPHYHSTSDANHSQEIASQAGSLETAGWTGAAAMLGTVSGGVVGYRRRGSLARWTAKRMLAKEQNEKLAARRSQ